MKNTTYKIYKKALSNKSSNSLFEHFIKVCSFFTPQDFYKKKFLGWEDKRLAGLLIKIRKDKKLFSNIYKTLQISNELQKIIVLDKLHKIASDFLKIESKYLTVRSAQLRIDPPNDQRNTYGWHQDNAYYDYNIESKNGAVLWIPLITTNQKNGTLVVKLGSENNSTSCSSKTKSRSKFKSEQILVKPRILKKYKSKHVNVKKNNALVIHAGTFHKSGNNTSNKVRFSIIVRFNKIFSKDFIYYRDINSYKPTKELDLEK